MDVEHCGLDLVEAPGDQDLLADSGKVTRHTRLLTTAGSSWNSLARWWGYMKVRADEHGPARLVRHLVLGYIRCEKGAAVLAPTCRWTADLRFHRSLPLLDSLGHR